ncbi:hypothetical protein [Kitasatospora sp. NPDC056184]|uniref:hypothetical protein n=1 Tax=Kitasatospora sp. NPDC056184 TaxID=3345738 RepID=UPI0035D5C70B
MEFPVVRAAGRICTAVLLALAMGACVSAGDEGKDEQLPVKARGEARAWARQMTEHAGTVGGVVVDSDKASVLFSPCTGKNGETAADGRYILMYTVRGSVPRDRHPEVVRKIRDMVTGEGLKIQGYRETYEGEPNALLDAKHPESDYLLSVDSTAGGDGSGLSIGVITPCLVPPPGDPGTPESR